jgi:integrase
VPRIKPPAARPDFRRLAIEADKLRDAEMSALTEYGYGQDWGFFREWCTQNECTALPATTETLSLFLVDQLAGKKVATVCRYASSIAYTHERAGYASPADGTVRAFLRGAQRIRAEQPRKVPPLSVEQLRHVSAVLGGKPGPVAVRDKAILVTGFASGLRRSNLAMLRMEDVTFCAEGFILQIRREKNDPRSSGRIVVAPYGTNELTCPVRTLNAWLAIRGVNKGPLFTRLDRGRPHDAAPLSHNGMWRIIKGSIDDAGFGGLFSPHSLRSGLISAAGSANVPLLVIAAQSGHKNLNSLQDYFRPAILFRSCAAGLIGL